MGALRLDGPQMEELKNLLGAAFLPQRFNEFLLYRLNRNTWNYAGPNDNYPTTLLRVIQDANATLWWRDLVWEARKAVPGDPGLVAFEEQFSGAPTTLAIDGDQVRPVRGQQLELKIKDAQSTFDIGTWRRRLGEIEGRVCRIEYPERVARGTGFLVGPSVVLTNYHVVEKLKNGSVAPAAAVLRFDYKVADDGVTVQEGTTFRLAAKWLADSSRYSQHDLQVNPPADPEPDELDYALLNVDGEPGNTPVGGPTSDPNPAMRRWIEMPAVDHDFAAQRSLYIVQHPDGHPMQVALDTEAVIGLNGNKTRVKYTTTTQPGSSGSPCFGPDWQWVALHHSGDPKYWQGQRPEYNQGIPVPAIRQLLTARGMADLLGACAARDWMPGDAAFRQLSDELTPLVPVGAPTAPLDRPSPRIAWRPLPADLPVTWLADMGGLPSLGAPGTLEVHILYTERSLRLESRRLAALRGELPDLGREAGLLPEDGCGLAVQPDGQRSAWQPLPADDLGAILDEDDLTERIATLLSTLACVNTQYSGEVGIAVGIATMGLLSEGRVADLPRTTPGTTERGWTSRRPVRVPARDALSFACVDVRPHEVAAELASRLIAKFRESCP